MKIDIKVIPRSSRSKIDFEAEPIRVYVHEAASDGKANSAVCEIIAQHYGVAKSNVSIFKGKSSRIKTIDIHGVES